MLPTLLVVPLSMVWSMSADSRGDGCGVAPSRPGALNFDPVVAAARSVPQGHRPRQGRSGVRV